MSESSETTKCVISAAYKKSIIENQWYEKMIGEVKHRFCKQLVWRNGEFSVYLTETQQQTLMNCSDDSETDISHYDGEMESLWDCCAIDYISDTNRTMYDLEEELEDVQDPEDFGWYLEEVEYLIIGPIVIEK